MTPEQDVAVHLDSLVGSLTLGTNLFTGPVRSPSPRQGVPGSVPSEAVFCIGTGGFDDVPFIDGGAKGRQARPTVQLTIRSDRKDYDGGLTLAHGVFTAIDKEPPTGYAEVRANGSQPGYVGEDDQEHHIWTVNIVLDKCEVV